MNDYSYAKLKAAEYDRNAKIWNVTFDVGVIAEELKVIKVDDESGKVVGFK